MSALATLSFVLAAFAAPHDPGLSSVHVRRAGPDLTVHAAFANPDFAGAVAIDTSGDGRIDADELARADTTLRQLAAERFVWRGDGAPVPVQLVGAVIGDDDDVELTLVVPQAADGGTLDVRMLSLLSRGHRCYIALLGAGDAIVTDALLSPAAATFAVPAVLAEPDAGGFGQAGTFFVLGIEHILIGFDHLAFLLALLVAAPRLRRVVATITAFTVAHSLTLIGAASGWLHLPGTLVEATIAGSIVVVALLNLRTRDAAVHRWPLAFGFGLVHGFGFAGVLADLDIGGSDAAVPLLTFNLGVEVGQLVFAAAVVPLLALAARRHAGRHVPVVVSILVGAAGCWWLVERLLAS